MHYIFARLLYHVKKTHVKNRCSFAFSNFTLRIPIHLLFIPNYKKLFGTLKNVIKCFLTNFKVEMIDFIRTILKRARASLRIIYAHSIPLAITCTLVLADVQSCVNDV